MSKLTRVSKAYYSLMEPLLYNRIAVAAIDYTQIPKLIRTLEPHLSIVQKNQLKTEGKYIGQQEGYSSQLDANATPHCVAHVRQVVIGRSNPGRKDRYIVYRYVEEALKNWINLEILETHFLTKYLLSSSR